MNIAQIKKSKLNELLPEMNCDQQSLEKDATIVVHRTFEQKADNVDKAILLLNCLPSS